MAVLVIAISIVRDALVTSPQESAQEFAAAQARWERRPFSHYRLVSEISSNNPSVGIGCQRDLEIQDEQVINVFRNDCPDWLGGMTVTDIFRLFRGYVPYTAVLPTPTGPKPCPVVIVANFDSHFGYPYSIETQTSLRESGSCFFIGGPPEYKVKIISLTPIP
jgi:hypothetical protein